MQKQKAPIIQRSTERLKTYERRSPADLVTFPTHEEISSAWESGFRQSQGDLRELGIKPDSEDEPDLSNNWFFVHMKLIQQQKQGYMPKCGKMVII